jgi:CHASE3 domain sensor protein
VERLDPESAPNAQSGPGRINREDDIPNVTSRGDTVTRMRTALIITTILILILAVLLAVSCAT